MRTPIDLSTNVTLRHFLSCVAIAVVLCSSSVAAELPDPLPSKITGVTVYQHQARVTREFNVPAGDSIQQIHIAGLPKKLIPTSAFTEADNDTIIRSLQVIPRLMSSDSDKLTNDLLSLKAKQKAAEQQLKVIEQDMLTLEKLVDYSSGKVQQNIDRATLDVQSVTALADFTMQKRRTLAKELFDQQTQIEAIGKQIKEKEVEISEQKTTTSGYSVIVSAQSAAGGAVRLTYDVSNANWIPKYKIEASLAQGEDPKFQIDLDAQIVQNSGEDWIDVQLTLSTRTPHSNPSRPVLAPLRVNAVPSAGAGSMVGQFGGTDAHAQSWLDDELVALNVRLNSQAGLRQIRELTASTEVQRDVASDASTQSDESYRLADTVTLPQSETTQTVSILSHDAKGEYYRVVTPLLTSFAFREALLLNETGKTLIAGAAEVYLDNQFVGRLNMPPTASGQKVTVGFGSDRQVRSRRELLSRRDTIKGGNKQSNVKYRLVVSNFHDQPIKIRLLDRMPIAAKDNAITLTLSEQESERLSKDPLYARMQRPTGILRWDLEIPAKQFGSDAFDHDYEYSVELDRQQTISGEALAERTQEDIQFNKMNAGGGMGGGGAF